MNNSRPISFINMFPSILSLTPYIFLLSVVILSGCDSPAGLNDEQNESSETNIRSSTTFESKGYEITMTDLGTLAGEGDSYAFAINDSGQIVGASYHPPSGKEVAVTWKNGEIADLGQIIDQSNSPDSKFRSKNSATAINNNGAIIVDRGDDNFIVEDGKKNRISDIDYISAINDKRQLSGNKDGRAVIWENGNSERLTGNKIKALAATHITNSGIVSGVGKPCFCSESIFEAILWENGKITTLGTLGEEGVHISNTMSVNDKRQVVGEARISADIYHAFLWEDGIMTDLGTLGDLDDSTPRSINESGQVVGVNRGDDTPTRAVIWIDNNIIDLGSLLQGGRSGAYSINDLGQIVGYSNTGGGVDHAVLWEIKKIE